MSDKIKEPDWTTLNLRKAELSDVKYEIHCLYDGEPTIKIDLNSSDLKEPIMVVTSIRSVEDLFILQQADDILKNQGVVYNLAIEYLMSQRMDIAESTRRTPALSVILKVLNSLSYKHIAIYQPHQSDIASQLRNYVDCTDDVTSNRLKGIIGNNKNHLIVGANRSSIQRLPKEYQTSLYFLTLEEDSSIGGTKLRPSEELHDTLVNGISLTDPPTIIIVDDILDVWTEQYNLIHEELKKYIPEEKLVAYLFVGHVVNPLGLEKVKERYDKVFITDSYDFYESHDNIEVFNV